MSPARPVPTLAAVLLALVVLPTSVTGSAVALPHIGAGTGASLDALQWVVHAYNLTFACFMLACGSLADLFGRRRVFLVGAVVFASASAASAVATDIHLLDVARGVAGAGAAALLTSGSSLVATTFEGGARTRAFTAVGIATGSGLALGAMLAGVLADTLGWRSFFAAHALLMLPVLCAVPAMRESRSSSATGVDWPGTAAFISGTFLLVLGVVEGPQWGWSSPGVLGLLAGAVLLLVLFTLVERRRRDPMLDLGLLRNAKFVALCAIPVVATCSFVVLLPLLPNYLLVANRSTSQAAGSTMLLMTLPILVTPLLAGRLIRWGASTRAVFAASLLCLTAGIGWLAVVLHPGIGIAALAGPLIALGVGLGLNFGLVDGAALAAVPAEKTGTAAGLLNTVRLGSEALVIAAAGSALVNLMQQSLSGGLRQLPAYRGTPEQLANDVNAGDLAGPTSSLPADVQQQFFEFVAASFTDSWRILLWACAAICALLSAAIVVLLREPAGGDVPQEMRTAAAR